MNERNKRNNIREELERGNQSRQAAQVLAESGLLSDAVSRLYYSVYHALRALLLTKGFEPKTHEGALSLLHRHFIKEKIFTPRSSHIIARLAKYRQEADYNPTYVFRLNDYNDFREEAEEVVGQILAYLKDKGYVKKGKE